MVRWLNAGSVLAGLAGSVIGGFAATHWGYPLLSHRCGRHRRPGHLGRHGHAPPHNSEPVLCDLPWCTAPDTARHHPPRFDLGVTHFDLANNYGPPYGCAEWHPQPGSTSGGSRGSLVEEQARGPERKAKLTVLVQSALSIAAGALVVARVVNILDT